MGIIDRHGKQETRHLARRLAEGDDSAIAILYRNYFHRLLFYGMQVAGNYHQHEVEDVIQELFIWLAKNTSSIKQVKDLEAYLFQSVRQNLKIRYIARQRNRASLERYLDRNSSPKEEMGHCPEQLHIRKEEEQELQSRIRLQLEQLPDYQREVLYLRYFENKSYSEIASLLSVSRQVAYNYVSRGIKRLKEQFAEMLTSSLFWLLAMAIFW